MVALRFHHARLPASQPDTGYAVMCYVFMCHVLCNITRPKGKSDKKKTARRKRSHAVRHAPRERPFSPPTATALTLLCSIRWISLSALLYLPPPPVTPPVTGTLCNCRVLVLRLHVDGQPTIVPGMYVRGIGKQATKSIHLPPLPFIPSNIHAHVHRRLTLLLCTCSPSPSCRRSPRAGPSTSPTRSRTTPGPGGGGSKPGKSRNKKQPRLCCCCCCCGRGCCYCCCRLCDASS